MHEGQSLENLISYVPHCCLREELGPMLDHLIEVLFHVLKDKEKLIVLSHHFTKTNNVTVLEFHQ